MKLRIAVVVVGAIMVGLSSGAYLQPSIPLIEVVIVGWVVFIGCAMLLLQKQLFPDQPDQPLTGPRQGQNPRPWCVSAPAMVAFAAIGRKKPLGCR